MTEREQLEAAISAQEAMRSTLGDAVVDMTIAALRDKLASLDPPADAAQRKLVTILFADVSGFTAMSETMDAEEVRDTMNSLWEKLDAAIIKHGGRVDKHIGDALMAIFGVPAAKEDDPERAVRAALALQTELAAFAAKTGRELKMRVGVNTGAALLGAVGSNAEFTAMGDAVNVASRLEHAAPIGGILISHDTYLHARGVFDVEAQEPLTVKGKKEPLKTYIVKRAKPRALRIVARGLDIETPMIGRDPELNALKEDMATTLDGRGARMTTLTGDAGMGKSRLLFEFTHWLELQPRRPWHFTGRASPETADAPYGMLRNLFSQLFQIGDNDSTADVHAKFERGVGEFLKADARADEKAHYIGRLLGFDFSSSTHIIALASNPSLVRERGIESTVELLRAAETTAPVLILLEDTHWADDASLEFVSNLLLQGKGLRLFVLVLARPNLYERRPTWGKELDSHRRLSLSLLSKFDCRRLVNSLLSKVESLPESLRDLVVNGSEGNPFYAEELIRMLIEDGVIDRTGEKWRVNTERINEAKIPTTLVGVLQARLDSLLADEKETLQRASVIGRVFWDDGLIKMSPPGGAGIEILDRLRTKDMVFRREPSAFAGAREYIFKHALLRDVAYESVLKKSRRDYHASAAEWLAARCGARVGEFATQLAHHYELAGENAKASNQLRRAAEDALQRGNIDEAVRGILKALHLEPAAPATRSGELFRVAAQILSTANDFERATDCIEKSLRAFESAGDRHGLAGAMNEACNVHRKRGDYPGHAIRAENFRALAETLADPKVQGDALSQVGWAALAAQDYPRSRELYEHSLAVRTKLGLDAGIASCRIMLGSICSRLGDHSAANRHFAASVEHYRIAGDAINEMLALANLGQSFVFLGDRSKARMLLDTTAMFQRAHGIKAHLANTLDSLAELSELEGDLVGAKSLYLEGAAKALEARSTVILLNIFAGYARMTGRAGSASLALAPMVHVLTNPSSTGEALSRAKEARVLIEKSLGVDAIAAALSAKPREDLFEYAAALLRVEV